MSSNTEEQELPVPARADGDSTLGRALTSVIAAGKEILANRRPFAAAPKGSTDALVELCHALLHHRGEASGLALAQEITAAYRELADSAQLEFFQRLANDFDIDKQALLAAAQGYVEHPEYQRVVDIAHAVEAPRQKLFRRINMALDGTRTLVALRGDLLRVLKANPELKAVDADLKHLFISCFNQGFLE